MAQLQNVLAKNKLLVTAIDFTLTGAPQYMLKYDCETSDFSFLSYALLNEDVSLWR